LHRRIAGLRALTRFKHGVVDYNRDQHVVGAIHTNTIEGFWALVKRAWYGQHHYYSKKYMALYISEACYKYNQRRASYHFESMVRRMVGA
jgi:hypothetical protein